MNRYFKAVSLMAICLPLAVIGQISHRHLLQKFTPQEVALSLVSREDFKPFPQNPGQWQGILPDTLAAKLLSKGDAALKQVFNDIPATVMLDFVRNGNRTRYEQLSFEKRSWLQDLVMAEAVEGKGRFADQIVNGIWSICEESFWGISAHVGIQKSGSGLPDVKDPIVDLFAAETGSLLAWTDYLVGPQLEKVSKQVRPRISYEIERRILTPMTTAKYGWMGGGNPEAKLNNWAPWIASNYLAMLLLIEKDTQKRTEGVYRAMRIVDQYLDGLGDDGASDEGPGYWNAAGGCVYDAINLLSDATRGKISIYQEPFVKRMASYIYETHIAGNYFINVADAHATLVPDGLMVYRFGKAIQNPELANFGSWVFYQLGKEDEGTQRFFRSRYLYNLLAVKECSAYPAQEQYAPDLWYKDVQLMASRAENGLFVSAHGGNNGESHNHNDVGDFTVYAQGQPVIIDVGSGTYTAKTFSKDRYNIWYNTSAYHNLPVINGKEQGAGTKFSARDVSYELTKKQSVLRMDIAGAYPPEAGVKSWQRRVEMDKKGEVLISDQYTMDTPLSSLTQTFMTVSSLDISKPGKIGFGITGQHPIVLVYDPALWDVTKEKIALTAPEDQLLKSSWAHQDIWRVLLTAKFHDKVKTYNFRIYLKVFEI
ncbi:Heparinase II/III-like protein [bacterium A37T11]|nr:Heparinase II/III-like protein [bacterium A37T11]